MSERTLVHRLEARGLTYSGLADEAKFEAAQELLRKGETIAETATRVGFAELERLHPRFQGVVRRATWRAGGRKGAGDAPRETTRQSARALAFAAFPAQSRLRSGRPNTSEAISNTSPFSARNPSLNDSVAVPKKWTCASPGRRNCAYLK